MKKRVLIFSVVVTLLFSIAFTGCGNKANDNETVSKEKTKQEETKKGNDKKEGNDKEDSKLADSQVLRYAIWSSPPGVFHPTMYEDDYDSNVNQFIYEGLIEMNPQLKFELNLAEKYEVSDDNLVLTFYLRKDVKWHDGKPFTAEDVAFTYESTCHPDYSGPRFSNYSKIKGAQAYRDGEADKVEGIEVIDKHTIRVTLSEVYAPALADIAESAIFPKHIWSNIPIGEWDEATEALRNPIGTGPFKFAKFEPDQYVEFVGNDEYHRGKPILEKIFLQVANQDTVQAQLIAGEIDFAPISKLNKDDIAYYKENGIVVEEVTDRGYQYMGINNRLDKFKDKRVRQAFAYAIDRQGMVDGIMEGFGVVANAPYASFSWALPKDGINDYAYNPEKAKELIASVDGYEYKGDTLYYKGKPLKLTLKYPTGNKVREASAPLIQQNLKAIGIEVELLIMEFGTLLEQVCDELDFDLYLMAWGLSVDPDQTGIWHSSITGPGGWNTPGFINKKSDELLAKGTLTLDQSEREKIYNQWARLMNDEMPSVFLYSQVDGRAYSPKIKGLKIFPYGNFYNIHKIYIAK
ncbi:peptide-binding protein [Oceanirhabdus sp. W0125-5]|uniref:peptide-binding protein n=1 Tax=Oceanirhabdus sp. W0125-5 TaxID=2999116 RepID=UPI0022F2D168|nr:ABC transporter substrate-binding protein [Oceanirhabdus sp. W0125-5]WBW99397.1 ABC transporter substrate-binding protein [Oceanirhabdus sp. W0125-5]